MSASTQKAASTSAVNLQGLEGLREMSNIPKVPAPDAFSGERGKLRSFLAKLDLYIGFNQKKFNSEMDKGLYTVAYLKDAAFDWVDPKLHEFLDKSPREREADKETIFGDFKKFKEELRKAFGVVDEKRAAERRLHTLKMDKSAAKYSAEFQRIAALTDWDDDALVSQYYWGLSEGIKDEIARRDRPEELQEMIDTSINIDSRQWERRMEKTGPYTAPRTWGRRFTTRTRGDPMDLDNIEKRDQKPRARPAEHGRYDRRSTKPHTRRAETRECYNCGKPGHLARDCKKPQRQRKEVATADSVVMHDQLSWTACYDDNCFVHMSSKDGAGWWPQKPKKRHSTDYATMSESKGLAILEKVVRDNSDEIEETDTRGTQDIGTAEAQGQEDLTWMYLDSDADPEDVDNWEVDMGLKQGYEHPENRRLERRERLLEEQQQTLQEEVTASKRHEAETAAVQLEELMTTVRLAIRDQGMPERPRKGHGIEIRLPTGYATPKGGRWMHTGGYMPPEFLNKVEALENLIQREYDQYEVYRHPERIVRKGTDDYVKLITTGEEPAWFKELWRKFTEPRDELRSTGRAQGTSIEAKSFEESKNLKLPQRD
jgi:hypothetical protein